MFRFSSEAYCCAKYGQVSGNILLSRVKCVGNESKIEDCMHRGWGVHNCIHNEDISIRCIPTNGKLIIHGLCILFLTKYLMQSYTTLSALFMYVISKQTLSYILETILHILEDLYKLFFFRIYYHNGNEETRSNINNSRNV